MRGVRALQKKETPDFLWNVFALYQGTTSVVPPPLLKTVRALQAA